MIEGSKFDKFAVIITLNTPNWGQATEFGQAFSSFSRNHVDCTIYSAAITRFFFVHTLVLRSPP